MPSNILFRNIGQKQEESESLPALGQSKNKLLGNRPYLWLWIWAQGRYHSSTWGTRKVAESKSIRESKSKRLSQRSAWLEERRAWVVAGAALGRKGNRHSSTQPGSRRSGLTHYAKNATQSNADPQTVNISRPAKEIGFSQLVCLI